jgi:hypothetical protein
MARVLSPGHPLAPNLVGSSEEQGGQSRRSASIRSYHEPGPVTLASDCASDDTDAVGNGLAAVFIP